MRIQRAIALLLACTVTASAVPVSDSYVLGAGDELYIDFPLRGTPTDLQPLAGNGLQLLIIGERVFYRYKAVIAPDGFMTLPSIGPIHASGMTLSQLRDEVGQRLSTNEKVSVILASPISEGYVVSGEVNHPNRFMYQRPTTLLEAVAMAGGATDHAQMKRVMVFHPGEPPVTIDLSDKTLRLHGPPSLLVRPSDSVVVPRRWFTPDNYMILILLSCITTAATVYVASKQ
jgi:polysaccharide export outer membrane protein